MALNGDLVLTARKMWGVPPKKQFKEYSPAKQLRIAAFIAASLIAVGSAPARAAGTPADEAATQAYFAAVYARTQAVVANLPASQAAFEGLADRIGGECPGVMAGAPTTFMPPFFGPHRLSARRRGELARESRQAFELEEELDITLLFAWLQPDRQATLAFAAAVEPLRWSNPAVAQSVHLEATESEEQVESASPGVCADMRAWVASGYRTLSAGTKEFFSRREASERRTVSARPVISLVAPYESAGDKALIDKTRQLAHQELSTLQTLERTFMSLRQTLGVTRPHAEEEAIETAGRDHVIVLRSDHGNSPPLSA